MAEDLVGIAAAAYHGAAAALYVPQFGSAEYPGFRNCFFYYGCELLQFFLVQEIDGEI